MLADYPSIVDYNFSPVQSPLFHHQLSTSSDEFLTPQQFEGVDFGGSSRLQFDLNHPTLFNDDDDLSSITPSIHNSESLDCDPHEGVDFPTPALPGHELEEHSIPAAGVESALAEEGLFGCEENDLLASNLLTTLPDGSLHIAENVSLNLLDSLEDDLDLCIANHVDVSEVKGERSRVTEPKSSSLASPVPEPPSSLSSTSILGESLPLLRKHKKNLEDKRWNDMNETERGEVAEHLSTVLGSLLGPRERLEVLAMVTQQQRSSLTDGDFVIEAHMLNESILAKLETFLEENEMKGEASDSELVVVQPERRKRGALNSGRRKCASLPASPQHRGSFLDSAPVLGRKKSHAQKSLRTLRRRTRKEYRQASKERRSGLFQNEEVIAVSHCIEEKEEEDLVDILS